MDRPAPAQRRVAAQRLLIIHAAIGRDLHQRVCPQAIVVGDGRRYLTALVDRAKGILMKSRGLSEDEAYTLLRKTAMNQNRKLADVAQSLVTAAELLGPGGN